MTYDTEAIRAALDVADVFGLKTGSVSELVCCPFPHHDDWDPSCNVDRRKQTFFCHGCRCGGDVIDFFGYREFGEAYDRNTSHFHKAAELAAAAAGIGATQGQRKPKPAPKRAGIGDVVAAIEKVAAEVGPRSNAAHLADLQARAVSQFDPRAAAYLRSRGLDPDLAKEYGAGVRRRWQGADRVTFPMTTPDGEVRQFYGRAIEPRPATWHHPERGEIPVEKAAKSSRQGLGLKDEEGRIGGWFNAPALRNEWAIYIAEGVPDALALIQSGYRGAVAPIGVYLGAYDPRWFTAIGPLPRPVYIVFNRDENGRGQDAAERAKRELEGHLGVMVRVEILHPPAPFNDWAEMVEQGASIELPKPEPIKRAAPILTKEKDPFEDPDEGDAPYAPRKPLDHPEHAQGTQNAANGRTEPGKWHPENCADCLPDDYEGLSPIGKRKACAATAAPYAAELREWLASMARGFTSRADAIEADRQADELVQRIEAHFMDLQTLL